MLSPQSWFILFSVLGAVVSLLVVIPAFRNRKKPGATGLLIAAPGASLFSIAVAPLSTPLPDWAVYSANNVIVTAGFLLGLGWFVTVGEHTETISPSRRLFAVAGVYLILVQALALTDPLHRLFFFPIYGQPSESLFALPVPVNIIHIICMYVLVLIACGLLLADILKNTGTRRKQSSILMLCIVLPVALNVFHFLNITPFNWMPVGFVGMTLGIGWAVLRADFLDLVPVSRNRAIRSMGDPVVTIDTEGRVIDANPAARKLSDVDANWENTSVGSFFQSFPDLVEQLQAGDEDTASLSHRGRKRDFSLTITEVGGREGDPLARVVVLREITRLKQRERELELLSQVQSRFSATTFVTNSMLSGHRTSSWRPNLTGNKHNWQKQPYRAPIGSSRSARRPGSSSNLSTTTRTRRQSTSLRRSNSYSRLTKRRIRKSRSVSSRRIRVPSRHSRRWNWH